MDFKQWNTFNKGEWTHEIDVRDFIQKNYTPYTGDESFLSGATERTLKLWDKVLKLYEKEKENGCKAAVFSSLRSERVKIPVDKQRKDGYPVLSS